MLNAPRTHTHTQTQNGIAILLMSIKLMIYGEKISRYVRHFLSQLVFVLMAFALIAQVIINTVGGKLSVSKSENMPGSMWIVSSCARQISSFPWFIWWLRLMMMSTYAVVGAAHCNLARLFQPKTCVSSFSSTRHRGSLTRCFFIFVGLLVVVYARPSWQPVFSVQSIKIGDEIK